jgi:hypothetical protein
MKLVSCVLLVGAVLGCSNNVKLKGSTFRNTNVELGTTPLWKSDKVDSSVKSYASEDGSATYGILKLEKEMETFKQSSDGEKIEMTGKMTLPKEAVVVLQGCKGDDCIVQSPVYEQGKVVDGDLVLGTVNKKDLEIMESVKRKESSSTIRQPSGEGTANTREPGSPSTENPIRTAGVGCESVEVVRFSGASGQKNGDFTATTIMNSAQKEPIDFSKESQAGACGDSVLDPTVVAGQSTANVPDKLKNTASAEFLSSPFFGADSCRYQSAMVFFGYSKYTGALASGEYYLKIKSKSASFNVKTGTVVAADGKNKLTENASVDIDSSKYVKNGEHVYIKTSHLVTEAQAEGGQNGAKMLRSRPFEMWVEARDASGKKEGNSCVYKASLISPVAIDFSGKGKLEHIHVSQTNVNFDLNNDGVAERTGWLGASAGFVTLDRNGNGKIDNGSELFGNHTVNVNGKLAQNGFEALAALDTNKDGLISKQDKQFASLKIWRDSNGNGVSEANELKSFAESGVSELNLNFSVNRAELAQGNAFDLSNKVPYTTFAKGSACGNTSCFVGDIYFGTYNSTLVGSR